MRKRNLGKTSIEVSELALGTWGLSGDGYGPVAEAEQDAVIERALNLGITLFETAPCYARGAMEKRLGERLPSDAVVITKFGTDRDSKPTRKRFDDEFLRSSLAQSQERLRRDKLDVVLLHNPSVAAVEKGQAAELLASWVEEGRVRAWGISAGEPEVVTKALAGEHRPAVVQMAYNALFSQDVTSLQADFETHGVGFLARSVLSHGLLAGFWGSNRRFAREDHRVDRWTQDQLERRLREINALRAAIGRDVPTVRSVAVRFVLDNPQTSAAILGPRSVVQLDQLVREAGKEPPYLNANAKQRLTLRVEDLGALR
jgi:aryl-alcohol dehydrogenase-like predicted oxidoreductase